MSKKIRPNVEGIIKLILSLSLVVYAIVVGKLTRSIIVIIAMFAASIGDINLMANRGCLTRQKEDTFEAGVLAFAISHIYYILAMQTKRAKVCFIIALILIIVMMIIYIRPKVGVELYICIIYAGILMVNVINAFAFSKFAMLGGILFVISDSILAICKLINKRNLVTQVAIWGTYVPAQICLLTAILLK